MTTYVVIDGGKSQLRLMLASGQERTYAHGPGFVYRPGDDGVEQTITSVTRAVESMSLPDNIEAVCAGLTGIPGGDHNRRRLSFGIESIFKAPVVLAEDSVLAHAGALGAPGIVLCVGTGTVALAISADGRHARVDGWGPQLGDRGSAYAIGLSGLRAATAALDGVGPPTCLTESLATLLGGTDLSCLQAYYRSADNVERTAGFARDVLAAAADDDVARKICARAAADLAATARSACDLVGLAGPQRRVSYSGRLLTPGNPVHTALVRTLHDRGLTLVEPAGGPLDGGLVLLDDPGLYSPLLWSLPREAS